MTRPQIPRVTDIVGAGNEALVTSRPHVFPFHIKGRYADVMTGWKGQCALALARLTKEAIAARLPLATGRPLADLLASEYGVLLDLSPQYGHGEIVLRRPGTKIADFPSGVIRAGTKFRRPASQTATQQIKGAEYEAIAPVFVGSSSGWLGGHQYVTVPIRATQAGAASSVHQPSTIALSDPLFDAKWEIVMSACAGGSDGPSTAKLRTLGQALMTGQYGPTGSAIVAGTLLTTGVSHIAVCDDPGQGAVWLWIADDSWAWSESLRNMVQQNLQDRWLGFGCKVEVGETTNRPVGVSADVTLRATRDTANTDTIAARVRASLVSYFQDRSDWYTWTALGIKAAISRADRRIQAVSTPVVTDLAGTVLAAPTSPLRAGPGIAITHFDLSEGNAMLTFYAPS